MNCHVFKLRVVIFWGSLKKELTWSPPRGGGHAIRPCLCMFRKGRPLLPWLHFGLHFRVIVGARRATILTLGSQMDHLGCQKWRSNFGVQKGASVQVGTPPPPPSVVGFPPESTFPRPRGRTTGGAETTTDLTR